MKSKKSRFLVKLIAIVLIVSLCVPIGAQAAVPEAVQPMASAYLAAYTAYICAMGDGVLDIWFNVTGTGTWADIGVLTIYLYESRDNENWYWVKTYLFEDYDNMLAHNTYCHMSYVRFVAGAPTRYYKAYVQIWAGPEDGGDSRYMWTEVERCT